MSMVLNRRVLWVLLIVGVLTSVFSLQRKGCNDCKPIQVVGVKLEGFTFTGLKVDPLGVLAALGSVSSFLAWKRLASIERQLKAAAPSFASESSEQLPPLKIVASLDPKPDPGLIDRLTQQTLLTMEKDGITVTPELREQVRQQVIRKLAERSH